MRFSFARLAFAVLLLAPVAGFCVEPRVETIPVDQIHAGQKGVAYTVFEGAKPEPMNLVVLGVLKNANGPKSDIILIRLEGEKPQYTGVVAGMSGSPVYIDGKLAGALAFRIGEFSKEPIAGVTPIAQMLEINAMDSSPAGYLQPLNAKREGQSAKTASPGPTAGGDGGFDGDAANGDIANYLKPIETPLVFSGFTEDSIRRFAPQLAAAGITPVMGTGSVSDAKQPEPLEPGSAVSAVLVRGDMNIAATCTVTYMDADRLLACGHPLMQFGRVDMPMYKAQVLATLPSPSNAFKIVNTTEPVGAFVQDRHTGVMGRFDRDPKMIPVTLTIHEDSGQTKAFHYEVLNNAKLTPALMMSTVFSALQGTNNYGEDVTYGVEGHIRVNGFPSVAMQNMYAPMDAGQPAAYGVAASIGERFSRIYENPFAAPTIGGVDISVNLVHERRAARLESARTDVTEARPGDEIVIEAALRPYRGERIVRQIPVRIPTSTPRGNLRILVSDGDTIDRTQHIGNTLGKRMDLASTIALLNKEHPNTRLYVSMLEANPEAMVEDKVMPAVPVSVMNVMEGMRGTQDMVVTAESNVNEASTPLDYVVAGSQVITVNVK
jgi:hypothetical protein